MKTSTTLTILGVYQTLIANMLFLRRHGRNGLMAEAYHSTTT